MSKLQLKKHLSTLTKSQIIELFVEVYTNNKATQEYLDYYLSPNEKAMFEKYRKIIVKEFYPETKSWEPKTRFSVCRKAIAEFRALKPSPLLLADLMLTLPEAACKFTYEFGDMWEQFYDSATTNFHAALKYMQQNGVLDDFKLRCNDCVKYASPCGYGFADEIASLYIEYYNDKPVYTNRYGESYR